MIIGKNPIKKYSSFAVSVAGYSHKNGICQDHSAIFSNSKMSICTVCDGHGDEKCFRSDIGSKICTEIAVESLKEFAESNTKVDNKNIKDFEVNIKRLKEHIIYEWNEKVHLHLIDNPISVDEVKYLSDKDKEEYFKTLTVSNYSRIYGTTLIAGIICSNFWLLIQLGDGDAVLLDERGLYMPMPEDSNNQFQYTSSICENDAIDKFRSCYGFNTPISMILSSDGLRNSYVNVDYFLGLYKEILNDAKVEDPTSLQNGLINDLPILSKKGSGDDISFAISYDKERLDGCNL